MDSESSRPVKSAGRVVCQSWCAAALFLLMIVVLLLGHELSVARENLDRRMPELAWCKAAVSEMQRQVRADQQDGRH